jgi:hypothetical protein
VKKVLFLEATKDAAITIASYLSKTNNYEFTFEKGISHPDEDKFDLVIPGGATSMFNYINTYGSLKIGELTYTTDNLITYDKIQSIDLCKKIGVPVPNSYINKSDLDFFPVFYKSLREDGYNERGIIRTKEELDALTLKTVFFQEFINTKGTYAVGFLADKGEIITTFCQDERISYPYHGGYGVVLKEIKDERLIKHTTNIVKAINYSGWGLVEYKYCDIRKDYVFMEVNAKFWASIEFAFLRNSKFLEMLFGIKSTPQNISTVVYIDRMMASNFRERAKCLPYLITGKWLKTQSLTQEILKSTY